MLSTTRYSLLAILSLATLATTVAQEKKESTPAKPRGPIVSLETVYLGNPIGNAHRIVIQGELGGKGQLTLDGNTCTVTQFGDLGVCTEIAFPPRPVEIVQLPFVDPRGDGRRLFHVRGEKLPEGIGYYLVIPRRRSETHRLVVDLQNDNRRVVTLERTPAPPQGKPGLAKNAEYRAEQADGKVTLTARGEHPTAGWKVAFEQLPIEIFPPQYRLVVVQPTGLVAQVITPFEVTTSFEATRPVTNVTIHDARGPHRVPVAQPKKDPR